MAHGKSFRSQGKGTVRSYLPHLLCLLCLLGLSAGLTACTAPRGPSGSAALPAPAEQVTAPPAVHALPAQDAPRPDAQAPAPPAVPVPPPGDTARPPGGSRWSSSWPGLGGLFGNLGKLGGAAIGAGHAKAAPPVKANGGSGATQVTVYYATDRQYHASSHNYGCFNHFFS